MPSHAPITSRHAVAAVTVLVASVLLTGCASSSSSSASSSTAATSSPALPAQPTPSTGTTLDLALPAAVTSLQLTDQSGQKVSLASLQGKTVVLTDFLTLCQEVCPLTSANFRTVQAAVDRAGLGPDVEFVEITVDPERDVVARLAAYQKVFGVKPNWMFLTGTPSQIATIWKTFGVDYGRTKEDPGPAPIDWWTGKPLHYDVSHQDVVFVLGPDGHEKWLVEGTPNTEGVKPPQPLLGFLNEDGQKNLTSPEQPAWTPQQVEQAVTYVTGKPVS